MCLFKIPIFLKQPFNVAAGSTFNGLSIGADLNFKTAFFISNVVIPLTFEKKSQEKWDM